MFSRALRLVAFCVLGLCLTVTPSKAQEAAAPAEGEAQGGAGAESGAQGEPAAPPDAEATPPAGATPESTTPAVAPATPPPPAPVLVIPIAGPDFDATQMAAVAENIRALLAPSVVGRPLRVSVPPDEAATAILACADPSCVGTHVSRAGRSEIVVLLRLEQARRQPVVVKAEVLDPSTGIPRAPGIEVSVPLTAFAEPATLTAALGEFAPLGSLMPPEPVRPRLLVAVNADDAEVSIDGTPIGQTPLAAVETTEGNHTIQIQHRGFRPFSRSLDVGPDGTRLDVYLDLDPEALARMEAEDQRAADQFAQADDGQAPIHTKWWFWAAVGGGAVLIALVTVIAVVATPSQEGFEVPAIPAQ